MDLYEASLDAARQWRAAGAAAYVTDGLRGVAERGVVASDAGSVAEEVAAVACGLVGDSAQGMARLVVAREESGGGEVGTKMWSAPPTPRYPPPKRRAVTARRCFPPGCGRDAAALLAGADDGSPFGDARADCGSAPPKKTDAAAAPLAGSKDGVLLEAFSPKAAPGALGKVTAADGAGTMADGGCHGPEAGVAKSSEASGRNGSQGIARSGSQQLVPAMRLLPKQRKVSAKRSFPPGCGRVGAFLIAGRGSSQVCLPLKEEAVATDGAFSAADRIVLVPCNGAIDAEVKDGELDSEICNNPVSRN